MPVAALCAAFDERSDTALGGVRERVRALGGNAPADPAHRPHLTLSAAAVDGDGLDAVVALAAATARRHRPIPLVLDKVGTFARGRIVWLGPSSSDELRAMQADVHDTLIAAGYPNAFGDHSAPRNWVPHCTLTLRAPRGFADRLRAEFDPIPVTVDAIATLLVGGRGDVAVAPLDAPA